MKAAQQPQAKLLLTIREAADALGVSESTLASMTFPKGSIRSVRVGPRGVRYSLSHLQEWIAKQEQIEQDSDA